MYQCVVQFVRLVAVAIGLAQVGVGSGHDPRSLLRGTPTGGGRFPFLAVVNWDVFNSEDPRVSFSVCPNFERAETDSEASMSNLATLGQPLLRTREIFTAKELWSHQTSY
jgi:hypothetical protein